MTELRFTCAKAGEHWCHLPHGSYHLVGLTEGQKGWRLTFGWSGGVREDLGTFNTCRDAKAAAAAREITRTHDAAIADLYRLSDKIFAACKELPAKRVVEAFRKWEPEMLKASGALRDTAE